MQNSETSTNQRERLSPLARLARSASVAILPVFACFLGGATQKWGEGVVIAILGFYLLIRPPRLSLGLAINCILAGLVALAAIAFFPHTWFFLPDWRAAVVNDLGISLPSTLTPQPWITLSCLVSFIAGLSWFYLVTTQQLDLRAVRFQLRLFAAGITALAALCVLLYLAHITPPFWINQRGFGPFPNRNQTADVFGITAIILLACTQDDIRSRRTRWLFWVAALGVITTAIILNFSRSGILILVGGTALWIGANILRQRSAARIAIGLSIVLVLLSILLLMGGQTFERFHLREAQGTGVSSDFRWLIFRDAFHMIRSSPWCGVGLGNFESIFAIFRNVSANDTRALHPESDWMWIWSELGWPSVILIVAGIALMVRRVAPLKEGTNQRFRLAALLAAFVFAAHGLIDVSAHRVGTSLSGMLLFGLALHRPLTFKRAVWVSYLFRFVGLILIIAGVAWFMAGRNTKLLPGSIGVTNAKKLVEFANRGRGYSEGLEIANQALQWAPLDWQLYYARGLSEVGTKQPGKALDDFRRARFLEPNGYEVPLAEGNLWLPSQPLQAVTAWREALRRAGTGQRSEVYSSMLSAAAMQKSTAVTGILEEIGLSQPDLALAFLGRATGAPFNHGVTELLKRDPALQMFSEQEKRAFFSLWSERGDLEQLAQFVQQHPDSLSFAWLGMARSYAQQKDFRRAYELTQRYGEAVALPRISGDSSFDELKRRFAAAPDNYAIGYALYREQMQRGQLDDALMTARHFSDRPNSPAYFHYLEAQNWAAKEEWERAWNTWRAYQAAASK